MQKASDEYEAQSATLDDKLGHFREKPRFKGMKILELRRRRDHTRDWTA